MSSNGPGDGFVNIDKPRGWTSFQTVKKIRFLSGQKKAGHAGTLDPAAGGVLVVLLGEACKTSRMFNYMNKEYRALVKLGYKSDTLDGEGNIEKTGEVNINSKKAKRVVKSFKGNYIHKVPHYSAKKHNGRTFYDIKRGGGVPPERKQKSKINNIEYLKKTANEIEIYVKCSSGTYIRTLAYDIARKLGTDGYLKKLTRIKVGEFDLKNSARPEKKSWKKGFKNLDMGLKSMDYVVIKKSAARDVKNGINFSSEDILKKRRETGNSVVSVFSENFTLTALAEKEGARYNLKRVFNR